MSDLPPGFELDTPGTRPTPAAAKPASAPPPGFDLDTPPEPKIVERGTILPIGRTDTGKLRLAQPQIVKDVLDAITLPGRVATGESPVTMDEIVNAAGLVAGGGTMRSGKVLTAEGKAIPKPVARALKSDAMAPEDVTGRLADIGPNAVIADLGPNLQAQGAAVATVPGAGQKTVVDKMRQRQVEAPDRLRNELDETLGPAPVPGDVKAGLKEQRKRIGPEYDPILDNAAPVDTSALAAQLDEAAGTLRGPAQEAVRKVRKMLDRTPPPVDDPAAAIANAPPAMQAELTRRHLAGEPLTTESVLDDRARTLFEVRRAIDGLMESGDSNVLRALGGDNGVRKKVDTLLATAAPGIKDIDAKYAALAKEGEAFDRGQTVLDSGRESPRPRELQAEVDKANAPYGTEYGPSNEAFRLSQGARAEIDRIVGTNLNDRVALNSLLKGEGDWNYDRLSTLFGKEKTDRIYKVLENERTMAETENKALANSKTAAVQAAQKEVEMSPAPPGVLQSVGDVKFGTAAKRLKDAIFAAVADRRTANQNARIADVLMSNQPLKSGTTGVNVPVSAIAEAAFRQDTPKREGLERFRRMMNERVY